MAEKTAWKSATPQLSLVLPGDPASQFHSTDVEIGSRKARRSGSLIRQALFLDQEDAYAAGEVGFLARALSTRVLFTISALGFTVFSLTCAFATSLEVMIFSRALQGFLGGAMIPTVFASG